MTISDCQFGDEVLVKLNGQLVPVKIGMHAVVGGCLYCYSLRPYINELYQAVLPGRSLLLESSRKVEQCLRDQMLNEFIDQ
jgi:hypothetical protein